MIRICIILLCLCTSFSGIRAAENTYHVFFLHNKILEDKPDSAYDHQYGMYEYGAILSAFQQRGYVLYADARPQGADPDQYSWLVARRVDSLLKTGVPANNITVVGSGKGALITMLASAHIRMNDVRYVVLSGCNQLVSQYFHIELHGTILSVREKSDYVWLSCDAIKSMSKNVHSYKEIELETGLQNGYLFKPMEEWLEPVYAWVEM